MANKLSVRRTLLLGIGTTGREVAERLAEHLNWQFGSFENCSWVKLLVLETEQTPSFLADRVIWCGMTTGEYAPYIQQPRATGSEFGFYDWQDGPTLGAIHNPSAGAGNCRMLGRLCLFHPRTYESVRMRVTDDIKSLRDVTPLRVAEKLGDPSLNVEVDRMIVVYVVGTLCGGTCSGSAADLGYLIGVWNPISTDPQNSLDRQAIFTIPHPALSNPRYKKNAYYALKELNHYQLAENPWRQRLPGFDEAMVRTGVPYDILRILMPGGATGEDMAQLNSMVAQYLAASAGPAGFTIAANDVNAEGRMVATDRIGFMRPLFSTMGVASLEYPGEHIQRAATSRLLGAALRRWCAWNLESVESAVHELGPLAPDDLLSSLTRGSDALSRVRVEQRVSTYAQGKPPRVEDVRALISEVDSWMSADGSETTLPDGSTAKTLQGLMLANLEQASQVQASGLEQFVENWFAKLEGGPGFLAAVLKKYSAQMEGWTAALQTARTESQQDARALRGILDDNLRKAEDAQNATFMLRRRSKLHEAWETVGKQLPSYYGAEVKAQALAHFQRKDMARILADRFKRLTAAMVRRLEKMQTGFEQEASSQEERWKELAKATPAVNGKIYFEAEPPAPRGSVTNDYYNLLMQRRWPEEPPGGWDELQKETAAARQTVAALANLRGELTREDGASAFDDRPGVQRARDMIPHEDYRRAEDTARSFFAALRDVVHIADKAGDSDIASVIQASEPKLAISAAQVSDQLSGVRGVTPASQDLAFTDMGREGTALPPALEKLSQRVRNSVQVARGEITNSRDPFRLLLIREKHGFTLGQMVGVVRSNKNDLQSLQSSEHCRDFNFWHTRRDVNWIDPLVPPIQVETAEEAWLLTVLLGRANDGVLSWTPAGAGDIDPAGWYTIASGEFSVFYIPGPNVSKPEERVPLQFNNAVALLLSPDYSTLRRTLNVRFSDYTSRVGVEKAVRAADKCLESLEIFGMEDIDRATADKILRRAYRRNDRLTRAFFDFKTENLNEKTAQFAHLYHRQGDGIQGTTGVYPADAYYCPTCNQPLGINVEALLEAMFRCPRCNTGERYWP